MISNALDKLSRQSDSLLKTTEPNKELCKGLGTTVGLLGSGGSWAWALVTVPKAKAEANSKLPLVRRSNRFRLISTQR